MASTTIAKSSSILLRTCAVLFFQYFPAHLGPVVITLFLIYVPAYIRSYWSRANEVTVDVISIEPDESKHQPEPPRLTEDGVAIQPEPILSDEDIKIRKAVVPARDVSSARRILLYGAPSSARPIASILTLLINLALTLLAVDALFRARLYYPADDVSFVRLGYVSETEARFLIREPDQAQMPVSMQMRIQDPRPPYDKPYWQTAGGVRWTANDTDFTAAITVSITHPHQRRYEWRTSNNHSGEFMAPTKAGVMPELTDGKFTFLSTSCILPRFPYSPLDHPLAIPGLRYLAQRLPELNAQFMLFLGDFIYIDVPQRFGKSAAEYRMQYRQIYASPDWPSVAQNLSWIHVLDDHEIGNDWSSNTTGVYQSAVEPWHLYQASVNPPKAIAAGSFNQARQEATWYSFSQGPASFFMMDTRTYRSDNNLPSEKVNKTMLGTEQLDDLLVWLKRSEPRGVHWKIIASSVPFTKNWPVNRKDTWGGFLVERRRVLEAMWEAGSRGYGVIVLSGDRHEFAATKFPPPPESQWPETAAVHEFSTSPLSQIASPIGTYVQKDDEDIMLKYIPNGQSKFGVFDIETIAGEPTLQYRIFIDGKEKWNTVVMAPPMIKSDISLTSLWDRLRNSVGA